MLTQELPAGQKWREFEMKALALRDFARVSSEQALNPFELARFANLLVVEFSHIKGLSKQAREHLLGSASEDWSGGACARALPDGQRIVVLNPNHGQARTNATLMEEISHVFLGHQPSKLKIVADDSDGQTLARDYRKADEEAAYAIGAAALVPFAALRKFVLQGNSAVAIAKRFRVSRSLVEYRLKVTRLWQIYKAAHQNESERAL